MLNIIENYYRALGLNPFLLKRKMEKLAKHPDIAEEFAQWISHREFKAKSCVRVNGYSAASLAQLSEVLASEAAFMLLIEMREDPERAQKRISDGLFVL